MDILVIIRLERESDTTFKNTSACPSGAQLGYFSKTKSHDTVPLCRIIVDYNTTRPHGSARTCDTAFRRASGHREEAASFTEATQSSQNGAATLGLTPGNHQASRQEEGATGGSSDTQDIRRPKEDENEDGRT